MILISAGHHEAAQGAKWHGHTEWPEACIWRDMIIELIPDVAHPVPSNKLRDKVEFINYAEPAGAIEIHFNSAKVGGKHVGNGCETLIYPGSHRGMMLAEHVQAAMVNIFPPNRHIKEGWHRMDRPGVVDYQGDVDGDEKIDYFLRSTTCPAIIIEPEFIHHIQLIQEKRKAACAAIATAILNFLEDMDA